MVPSPPSTTARSASSASTIVTPHRSAIACTRASAPPTPSRSIVTTAARLTDGIVDPPVEVGWELCVCALDEVEDELMVSLRAGETRVYDAARFSSGRDERFRHLAHDAPL